MQNRFQKSQREIVRSKFGEHPLLKTCQYAFKQFEGKMPMLKFTPEEIFYESAVLIDRVMEEPTQFDSMLPTLWDDLLCEYMDFDRNVPETELILAVTCVYYATTACFALHNHAGYCFTFASELMEDIHKHNPAWQEFELLANEKLHYHSKALNEWINSYSSSETYLSDDIADALVVVKKKTARKDKKADFSPVRTTFCMTSRIVSGNIALVCQELAASGWIDPETDPNKWQKLFGGVNSSVKIVWTGKVGIGSLKALFEMMEDDGYISHASHTLNIILRSHFVDYEDNPIGDFRGSTYTSKSDSVIETCRDKLELQL